MKTIVDAKPFSDALANACTVPRKSRIPCLNEVYVHAYPDKCICLLYPSPSPRDCS